MSAHAATARTGLIPTGQDLVRAALRLDAVVTGANGAAYLAAAGALDGPLGVSAPALRGVGAFLLAFAALVWLAAARPAPRPAAVTAIVAANVIWAVDSVVLVAAGVVDDAATLGAVWIVLQAVVVGGFAALQAYALRRAG
jgi:hypothetical protein